MTLCATPGCGKELSSRSPSGLCRPCCARRNATDPAIRQKVSATHRANMARDPEARQRATERARAASASRCPQKLSETAKRTRLWEHSKGRCWMDKGPESRRRTGARISATKLAHIPAEVRPFYRQLIKSNFSRAEAQKMALEQAEVERRRIRAELSGARQ